MFSRHCIGLYELHPLREYEPPLNTNGCPYALSLLPLHPPKPSTMSSDWWVRPKYFWRIWLLRKVSATKNSDQTACLAVSTVFRYNFGEYALFGCCPALSLVHAHADEWITRRPIDRPCYSSPVDNFHTFSRYCTMRRRLSQNPNYSSGQAACSLINYRRQGGYVFVDVCSSVTATLRKRIRTDLHEIFREGWHWDTEQVIKFRWRSRSPSEYRDFSRFVMGDTESG